MARVIGGGELARREAELFNADWAKARLGREPTAGELARTAVQRRADGTILAPDPGPSHRERYGSPRCSPCWSAMRRRCTARCASSPAAPSWPPGR